MRSVIFVCLCALFLASCGGSEGVADAPASGLTQETGMGFTFFRPTSWSGIAQEDLQAPATGKYEMAFRSSDPQNGFYNNLLILSEDRGNHRNSATFVDQMVVRDARYYAEFDPISTSLVTLADGQESMLHIFRAKYNTLTAGHIFLQSGALCADRAFMLTIGLHATTSEEDISRYESIVQSFGCVISESNE